MSDHLFEAARYALLRRLAPAIRHSMVGWLHPVVLTAEILERRIRNGDSDLEKIRMALAEIVKLSRSAIPLCSSLVTWLAPDEDALTGVDEGIRECIGLLETDFALRGFSVEYSACSTDIQIKRTAVRHVLTASLITATDAAPGPSKLKLTTSIVQHQVLIHIEVQPDSEMIAHSSESSYRALNWYEVEALAFADHVELSRPDGRIVMRYIAATVE